jgi:hypothetical protein
MPSLYRRKWISRNETPGNKVSTYDARFATVFREPIRSYWRGSLVCSFRTLYIVQCSKKHKSYITLQQQIVSLLRKTGEDVPTPRGSWNDRLYKLWEQLFLTVPDYFLPNHFFVYLETEKESISETFCHLLIGNTGWTKSKAISNKRLRSLKKIRERRAFNWYDYNILCFVDRASGCMRIMKPMWCTIYLQFIQSLYLYMFRAC